MRQGTLLMVVVALLFTTIATSWYLLLPAKGQSLKVSTTTSLYETGVLDQLKSRFEAKYPGYSVDFISQGTGLAIRTAERGDADVVLVHDPKAELAFLQGGYGVNRKVVAYNFFIIVGPQSDPAKIKGLIPLEAMRRIADEGPEGNALWVSRGDDSGTHSKERSLWAAAGLNLTQIREQKIAGSGSPWYIEAGSGMTATLQLANEKGAYTLTDVASFLKNSKAGNVQLVKLVDAGRETLNVYSAIVRSPKNMTKDRFDLAMLFVRYLASDEGQDLFRTFGLQEYGEPLFKPWVTTYRGNSDPALIQWVKEYAFFNGTECPTQFRYGTDDLYG